MKRYIIECLGFFPIAMFTTYLAGRALTIGEIILLCGTLVVFSLTQGKPVRQLDSK